MKNRHSRRTFIKNAGWIAGAAGAGFGAPQQGSRSLSVGERFRALLAKPEPLQCIGAYDVLTARLIELEGFQAITVGGSAASGLSHGIPDFGLITITELIEFSANIAEHTNLPVLADADDGGGSPLNVYRATKKFERAGIAAVMFEDTVQMKHLKATGNELVTRQQMVDKIRAAVDARKDPGFVIIARNDSLAEGHSMQEALDRGAAYSQAGADVLYFSGMRLQDCPKAREAVRKPLMSTANATTSVDQLKAAQISLVVYASPFVSLGLGVARQALLELKSTGAMRKTAELALPRDIYSRLAGSAETIERARKYNLIQ
ncbi:MAG: isocitrate lyase/PEP mutase family protein [Acidobacteria bacterium]|nr:isocitrate lyase/PEP mutase family protein [Acidobacteriota bacterium]